jgi:hypothetical protein
MASKKSLELSPGSFFVARLTPNTAPIYGTAFLWAMAAGCKSNVELWITVRKLWKRRVFGGKVWRKKRTAAHPKTHILGYYEMCKLHMR